MLPIEAYLDPKSLVMPASEQGIEQAERGLGATLPPDYLAFLRLTNGYDGFVGSDERFASFLPVEDLVGWKEDYDFMAAFPAVILIGSNGGPTAYGFEQSPSRVAYITMPFGCAARSDIRELGSSFPEFIQAIAGGEGW